MGSSDGPGARRVVHPVARVRLERVAAVPASALPARERPPVFHVFEELYARTRREMRSAALATGHR
jgi:hypothetical protein